MIIRKMKIEDYDKLYGLWMSCTGVGLNNLDDSKEGIERFIERNPETCLVAYHDDKLVGAIMIGSDGRRGYIYHTVTDKDYRRQGIASRLVEQGLEELKKLGINKVALVAFKRNETGNAFWQSQGFTVREDLTYRNKTLVEMERIDL